MKLDLGESYTIVEYDASGPFDEILNKPITITRGFGLSNPYEAHYDDRPELVCGGATPEDAAQALELTRAVEVRRHIAKVRARQRELNAVTPAGAYDRLYGDRR